MPTQYKFYKTTCTADNIDTTSATKNPLKLDEVENGGIVLAVDNTSSSPNFGRMYFKNPFGTAYGKDGKLFEVGTNVSTLRVNGLTYDTFVKPDQIEIVDQNANESVIISKGNIQFANINENANGTISADANLTLNSTNANIALNSNSPNANITLNSSTLTITGSIIGNITFNGDITTNTRVNTDAIYPKTTGGTINLNSAVNISDGLTVGADLTVTGINTVGTRVSIGDVVAPAVDWQGDDVSASGVHVWHNSDNAAYGVSIVGATDASGGGVYPQIRVYDGTANTCTIDMNGRYGDIKVSRNIRAEGTISGGVVKGTQLEIGSTFYRASFVNGVLSFSAV